MSKKFDWKEIQKFYDINHTWRDISIEFGCSLSAITKASRTGRFMSKRVNRTVPYPCLSEETKKKISISRKKYLQEHPEKIPYVLNHYKKESWLEKTLNEAMFNNGIHGYEREYRNGIYCYDFAFVDIKLDIEVDGQTHEQTKVKEIDKRRDEWSISNGWTVLRFNWEQIRYHLSDVLCVIKNHLVLMGHKIHHEVLNVILPKRSIKKVKKCLVCEKQIGRQSFYCRKHSKATSKRKFILSKEEL